MYLSQPDQWTMLVAMYFFSLQEAFFVVVIILRLITFAFIHVPLVMDLVTYSTVQ